MSTSIKIDIQPWFAYKRAQKNNRLEKEERNVFICVGKRSNALHLKYRSHGMAWHAFQMVCCL